jgi:hypothetical protein
MTEEQVTSYPKSVDEVENLSPVETCVLLLSTQLVIQELYILITTSPANSIDVICGLLYFLIQYCK